jgi:hypothetical protein
MSGEDGFLARWSRQKREAERKSEKSAPRPADGASRPVSPNEPPNEAPQATADPAFDIAKLPPIETITDKTDIQSFLLPGVPAALKQAALRRAWGADPKIRDFVGLAEYAWDFNAPDSMPGFGPLNASDELRRLALEGFKRGARAAAQNPAPGESTKHASAPPKGETSTAAEAKPGVEVRQEEGGPSPVPHEGLAEAANHARDQNMICDVQISALVRRGHGGALPE